MLWQVTWTSLRKLKLTSPIPCLNHPVVYRNWAQLMEKKTSHFEEHGNNLNSEKVLHAKKKEKRKKSEKIVYSWLGSVDNDESTHKKTGP